MRRFYRAAILFAILLLMTVVACKKDDIKKDTLIELHAQYKNGEISECTYKGETVFTATLNAYDAPTIVYDEDGNEIGNCNYAWGSVDPLCYELESCEVVYRVHENIWGRPAVDVYHLN